MPNTVAGKVAVDTSFQPQGRVAGDVPSMPGPTGRGFEAASAAGEAVANQLGRYADEAAVNEGRKAGARAGLNDNFRPDKTASGTLYGKSFDKAATATYLDTLETKTRLSLQDVYDQHRDDPAGLKVDLDKLHAQMSAQDLFPEAQGHFNKHFAILSTAYRRMAQSNAEAGAADADKAQLIKNLSDNTTSTQRALASLNPNDPATEGVVLSGVNERVRMYQSAADKGAMSEAAATTAAIAARNDGWTGLLTGRALSLGNASEVQSYLEKVQGEYANGKYPGLDGDGFQKLQTNLTSLAGKMVTRDRAASGALGKAIDDYVTRAANGNAPPPDEWNALAMQAKNIPNGDDQLALGAAKLNLAKQLRASSVINADRVVSQLRQDFRAGDGTDTQRAKLITFGQKLVDEQRKDINTDQLGYAQKKGLVTDVVPLDFDGFAKSADAGQATVALAGQVQARVSQAQAVAGTLERAPQYLRPEEKARLKEIVDQGGDRALALAGAIVKGGGDAAPAILHQIGDDAPIMAQAGVILANGGSLQAARDALKAAEVKRETGKELPQIHDDRALSSLRSQIGAAFALQPDDGQRVRVAAASIAATRIAGKGLDPTGSAAVTIYNRSLQEAAGARFEGGVQYGGVGDYKPDFWTNYKVLVPGDVRADRLRDVIRSVRDDDLKSLPVPPQTAAGSFYRASDIAGAVPVAVRGGYRLALGDPTSDDPRYIRGADGRPFVLDLESLAPTLRQRVPGAYLGGR